MKTIQLLFLAFILSVASMAQVKIVSPLKGEVGNKSILEQATGKNKIYVERFSLFFRVKETYQEPSMGMVLTAKINLEKTIAKEITDSAFSYFKTAFLAKGLTVEAIEKEIFRSINDVKKAEKKGETCFINGDVLDKKIEKTDDGYIEAHATGVNYCPIVRPTLVGTYDTEEATTVSFIEVINFSFPSQPKKKGGYGSIGIPIYTPCLMLDPNETVCGTGGFGFWNSKLKGGSVSFPVNADIRWEGFSWLTSTKNADEPNTQNWTINPEEYKKAALELSKSHIDQYIEEYMKGIAAK